MSSSTYKIQFSDDAKLYMALIGVKYPTDKGVRKFTVHPVEVRPGQNYQDLVENHGMHLFYQDIQAGAELMYLGGIELADGKDQETVVIVNNNRHVEGVSFDDINRYQQSET